MLPSDLQSRTSTFVLGIWKPLIALHCVARSQVFDLAKSRPNRVLEVVFACLRQREEQGDELAGTMLRNARVVVSRYVLLGVDPGEGWKVNKT